MASSSLNIATFQGMPGGSNLAVQPHEIPDVMGRYLQDVLLDQPGIIRLRGPVSKATGTPTNLGAGIQKLVSTIAPDGSTRIGFVKAGNPNGVFGILSADYSTVATTIALTEPITDGSAVVDAKPMISNGVIIGASDGAFDTSLFMWLGAAKGQTTVVNGAANNVTISQGSTALVVGGSSPTTDFTQVLEPGMFVLDATTNALIGVIDSVSDSHHAVLRKNALNTISATDTVLLSPIRAVVPRMVKGRITVAAGVTTVVGAGTKWGVVNTNGLGTLDLFRTSDMKYIGTVTSVQGDEALTLTAGATVDCSNEAYALIPRNTGFVLGLAARSAVLSPGVFTTTYAGFQFYAYNPWTYGGAGTTRVWFSSDSDPEGLDFSLTDGDFFDVTSQGVANTPITQIVGLQNALAIFKDTELFVLTGNDPTNFTLRKIADVGTWAGGTVVNYQNAIIFASRTGVFKFDGVTLTSLSDQLGDWWKQGVQSVNAKSWAGIYRDHYILYVPNFTHTYKLSKGTVANTPVAMTLAINLLTGAITFLTNLHHKGFVTFPSATGKGTWFLVPDASNNGVICDMATVWNGVGTDSVIPAGESAGPSFYIETKRYNFGQPELLKRFIQLAMNYTLTGDTLTMDTVRGLNEDGVTANTAWQPTSGFQNKRIRFQKIDTHIGFRLYESAGTVRALQIGPWAIGFKPQRAGRV